MTKRFLVTVICRNEHKQESFYIKETSNVSVSFACFILPYDPDSDHEALTVTCLQKPFSAV